MPACLEVYAHQCTKQVSVLFAAAEEGTNRGVSASARQNDLHIHDQGEGIQWHLVMLLRARSSVLDECERSTRMPPVSPLALALSRRFSACATHAYIIEFLFSADTTLLVVLRH